VGRERGGGVATDISVFKIKMQMINEEFATHTHHHEHSIHWFQVPFTAHRTPFAAFISVDHSFEM